jgi:hypothetical protein
MDAAALVAVPDAGDELAELRSDDPEAEPVPLAGEVVDEQRVPPVPPVHLVQNGKLFFCMHNIAKIGQHIRSTYAYVQLSL